jgi:sporulation protein YlmC with PRC-barrel domain
MLKTLSLSASLVVLASGLALAQLSPADRQPALSHHTPSSLASTDHWLASDIYHAAVYDPSNNKIGDVSDLVLDSSGQVRMAVIGVGGFLGIGKKEVAVPFHDLKVASRDGKEELTLDRTKDELKAAPAYDKNAKAE